MPNTKHSLADSDEVDSIVAFFQAVTTGRPRPRFSWTKEKDGSLVVTALDAPSEVKLWQAANPKARDFRLDIIGKAYTSTSLTSNKHGVYVGKVGKPEHGYSAFFVELTYPGPGKEPHKFTTEVSVVPDTLPFRWEDAMKKYPAGSAAVR